MTAAPKHIELIARALIVRDRRVLTCREIGQHHCSLPGGHIDPGEAAATALSRELAEEAGLGDAHVGACLLVQEHRFDQRGKPKHELNMVFHVEPPERLGPGCPPIAALEPKLSFAWVAISDLGDANLLPAEYAGWLASGVDLDKTCWQSSPAPR
ncbi:MAG: NUDIX domain-containing protein [Phycisphaerales bacterium]|nr:NUDIX domain-containing protein [Phycisphaerales bacterium]